MPYLVVKKKRTKKIKVKKMKVRKYANKQLQPSPFNSYMTTRLNYADTQHTLTVSGGSTAWSTWRINDPYTRPPRYWNTLVGADGTDAPYKKFIVTGCKYEVVINQYTSGAGGNFAVGCRSASATQPSSIQEALERGWEVRDMPYYQSGPGVIKFTKYVPMYKIFQVSKQAIADNYDIYGGDYQTAPNQLAYIDILAEGAQTTTSSYGYRIKITYYVKLFDKNDVLDS